MKRRGFIGSLFGVLAVPAVKKAPEPEKPNVVCLGPGRYWIRELQFNPGSATMESVAFCDIKYRRTSS